MKHKKAASHVRKAETCHKIKSIYHETGGKLDCGVTELLDQNTDNRKRKE